MFFVVFVLSFYLQDQVQFDVQEIEIEDVFVGVEEDLLLFFLIDVVSLIVQIDGVWVVYGDLVGELGVCWVCECFLVE